MNIENWVYSEFDDVLLYGNTDLRVNCPFCVNSGKADDIEHHLYISLVKQVAHCFRCGYKAGWTRLVVNVTGCDYHEVSGIVGYDDITPLYRLLEKRQPVQSAPSDMPDDFMMLDQAIKSDSAAIRANAMLVSTYVMHRLKGVSNWRTYLSQFGILTSNGWGKLVMPVERGWWQHRHVLYNYDGPKYISCSAEKGDRLYNYRALERNSEVLIAEGIISACHLGASAVALCGKEATPKQVSRLCKSRVGTFVLCLDSDARDETYTLARALFTRGKRVLVRLYTHGDPAECNDYEELEWNFASAVLLAL